MEGIDIGTLSQLGVFGVAFFVLLRAFLSNMKEERTRNEERINMLINEHKRDTADMRNGFIESLHEITKQLIKIDTKLDWHIKESGNDE